MESFNNIHFGSLRLRWRALVAHFMHQSSSRVILANLSLGIVVLLLIRTFDIELFIVRWYFDVKTLFLTKRETCSLPHPRKWLLTVTLN